MFSKCEKFMKHQKKSNKIQQIINMDLSRSSLSSQTNKAISKINVCLSNKYTMYINCLHNTDVYRTDIQQLYKYTIHLTHILSILSRRPGHVMTTQKIQNIFLKTYTTSTDTYHFENMYTFDILNQSQHFQRKSHNCIEKHTSDCFYYLSYKKFKSDSYYMEDTTERK